MIVGVGHCYNDARADHFGEDTLEIPAALIKTFNTALNEMSADLSLIALKEDGFGLFQAHAYRGFSPRETQAILRALSYPEIGLDARAHEENGAPKVRIRMTAPAHRSLLGTPLRVNQRVCGALVIGRKDVAAFSERDRRQLEETKEELETAIAKADILPTLPTSAPVSEGRQLLPHAALTEMDNPAIESLMADIRNQIPYDRALLTRYDPESQLLTGFMSCAPGHIEWRHGQTYTLDASAAGWVLRHMKPRLDRDLASTQGRFLDYKELYKDKFKTALVLPLRRGADIIGTIALSSRTPNLYNMDMQRAAAGRLEQLAKMLPSMGPPSGVTPSAAPATIADSTDAFEAREIMLRQERQAAIRELTAFLEQDIQRTLTKTRMELEETLTDTASGETLTVGGMERIEQACRELTGIEAILNEILDHAKPLELHPRVVRIPDVIDSALAVIANDIEPRRIKVTRQFPEDLPAIRADEGKLQQVFLSILKNALEAMSPEGHIHIEALPHKGARGRHEVALTIQNDGAPIPTEHIGKIFEPGFTTKAAGTGLGLSSVKKIIEEHRGQISIASGPGQGTAAARHPGRGRRRPRRR